MLEDYVKGKRRLVVVGVALFIIFISWVGVIDSVTKSYVDGATLQALGAFASARALNAIVSVAQSVQLEFSFVGGFAIQPLESLDPLNDLVEQYSSLMKFSIGSLVAQKVLVEMVSTFFFKILISIVGLLFIASLFLRDGKYSALLMKAFAMAGLVRFLFVLVFLLNGVVDKAFVDERTKENLSSVKAVAEDVDDVKLSTSLTEEERNQFMKLSDALEEQRSEIVGDIEQMVQQVEEARGGLEEAQTELANIESDLGTIERLNMFDRDEVHESSLSRVENSQALLSEKVEDLESHQNSLDDIDEEVERVANVLSGESAGRGWMSGMKDNISNMRDMANFESIKSSLEGSVSSIINLMALFFLKTLVFPLVFLAIFIKGFKYIWGVDPMQWVKKEVSRTSSTE